MADKIKETYTLEYAREKKIWYIWCNTEGERGFGLFCVFKGTRKECQEQLKVLKDGKKRI